VAEMVAVHGLRSATGGSHRGPTGYSADQQQTKLYAVNKRQAHNSTILLQY